MATAETETTFKPVRLWNLGYPNETVSDRAGFGPKDDPAGETVYQFAYGVFTARTPEELARVKAICGSRVVEEDVLPPAKPLVCGKCGRDTRSSRWYQKHVENCLATEGLGA